jgi:hypothetical protein
MQNGNRNIGYWMPLKHDHEVYVHFGIGVAESMGMKPGAPVATAEFVDLPH